MPKQTLNSLTEEFLANLAEETTELKLFLRSEEFPRLMQLVRTSVPHKIAGFLGGSAAVESKTIEGLPPEKFARVSDAILNEHGRDITPFQTKGEYEGINFTRTLGQGAAYVAESIYK